jgi:putative flippase GtrA
VRRQLLWFVLTGATAALTHLLVVVLLVEGAALAPLVANAGGFAVAFLVSYAGHRQFTFAAQDCPHRQGLPRFLLVACVSFLLNEGLFALLLAAGIAYPLALFLALLAVAALTFVLARYWAFTRAG